MNSPPVVLERIYPKSMNMENSNDRDSLEIHEARYRFAAERLSGQSVLDMACGCGFGSALMAALHPHKQFVGIDIDPEAIDYAKQHYTADNLRFICADAMTFRSELFDNIVSLETIEHLPDPKSFIVNLPNLLANNGKIIASVPVTPTCDGNPHHLHDFSEKSFKRLFLQQGLTSKKDFRQVQPWVYDDAFSKSNDSTSRSKGVGNNVLAYYRKHPAALFTRVYSLLCHGACNIYLTCEFTRQA